jgi:hypothetical protein
MQHPQYDGVILQDKWGKTYLCSTCLLAYHELGNNHLSDIQDAEYGKYFLHDLEPQWNQRQIWADIHQHARPWHNDISAFNDHQLRDNLLQLFANNEMWVWPLSDGWGQPPEGNGIGEGGLAPATTTTPTKSSKAAKPKGGGVTTDNSTSAKVAGHEASNVSAKSEKPTSKKVEPESLEHAQKILAQRRAQIEQSGYQPKYSDTELLAMAKAGDIANDRFHVRLVFNNPENAMNSTLGFRRNSGRAPYWATTFDMAEAADTDPELLACIFGIENYSADYDFSLVIIDTHNLPPQAERQTFVPTFDNMTEFCNGELSATELGNCKDVSEVMNNDFAAEYELFMADYAKTGESEYDRDAIKDHADETEMDKSKTEKVLLRHKIQTECGANPLFAGNGLTKVNHKNRYGGDVPQQYGVAETFTFERDPLTINELGSAVVVIPAKPIKG